MELLSFNIANARVSRENGLGVNEICCDVYPAVLLLLMRSPLPHRLDPTPQQNATLRATSQDEVFADHSEPDPADNLAHTAYTSTFPNPVVAEIVTTDSGERQRLQHDRWLFFFC